MIQLRPLVQLRRLASAALVLSVLLLQFGCLATWAQVQGVEERLVKVEKAHAGFLVMTERETKRLQTLAGQVEESNNQLRDTLARAGAKLSEMDSKMAKVRGELEVLLHRLEIIEKTGGSAADLAAEVRRRLDQLIADLRDRAGIAILGLPVELPADAEGFAKLAEAKLVASDIRTAAAVAVECQKRFDGTEAAARCAFVQAKIASQEQRYSDATRLLQTAVVDKLGGKVVTPPIVGDALLEIARILELQGRCATALKVLKYLIADMAKLPAAKAAKELVAAAPTRCKEGGTGKPESDGKKPEGDPAPLPKAATGS